STVMTTFSSLLRNSAGRSRTASWISVSNAFRSIVAHAFPSTTEAEHNDIDAVVAVIGLGALARHLRHPAHVDADRRQNLSCAYATNQSLLEHRAARDIPWSDDAADALSRSSVHDHLRFPRSPA